jgi:hypothetical protein
MRGKKFRLKRDQIKLLVCGYGGCIASDLIPVGGSPVGFMFREEPDETFGSGWWFLSGRESQAYLDNPDNFAIYDVNTIAN